MAKQNRRPPKNQEDRIIRALDELSEYEEFTESVAPLLRQAIKEGWSADKLARDPRLQTLLLARQMTIALADKDSGKALAAIKDLRDRTEGRATERIETTHKLEKMPDNELDALLLSKLSGQKDDSDTLN